MKYSFIILILLASTLKAQELKQTVRGKVIDEDSKAPLIGVNLKISNESFMSGTSTDVNGNFKIEDVPVGRYLLEFSYIGYKYKALPNLDVDAGKEKVITVELTESFQELKEITVTSGKEKHEATNDMAIVSARSFSLEETKRYAGSANDPARMASSFAGVSSRSPSSLNDIIIRGNSPRGLLWRINGIEVPNPNHFATAGSGGGGISVINSNVLANSDFYTGAFPAEYGNAFSGIFDIGFRQGNNEKYEYAVKGGLLGSDISAEGPINRKQGSSFLFNYRYSTLSILNKIGVFDDEEGIDFQDFTYNVYLPTKNYGNFSVFGILSRSGAEFESEFILSDSTLNSEGQKVMWDTIVKDDEKETYSMGTIGINHLYFIDQKTFLKSYVAADITNYSTKYLSLNEQTFKTFVAEESSISNYNFRFSSSVNRKFNSKNTVRLGIIVNGLNYAMNLKEADTLAQLKTKLDDRGTTSYSQAYFSWKYKFSSSLLFTLGSHLSYFELNDELLLEPRAALKWQFTPLQSISAGYGLHSRREDLSAYFGQTQNSMGDVIRPNTDLEQIKAAHYVLGYDYTISENLHFKAELYYQDLFDVGVDADTMSAYSLLNQDNSFTTRNLKGSGVGKNYGLELTLEKFFSNQYYFLVAVSLYDSKYEGSNSIEYNTRYNGNHLTNLAIGKEMKVGDSKKNRKLVLNGRATIAGNNRYTSIDLEKSIKADRTILNSNNQNDERLATFARIDCSIALVRQKKNTTREWKIDVLNVLNTEYEAAAFYNNKTKSIEVAKDGTIIPVLSYQIKF